MAQAEAVPPAVAPSPGDRRPAPSDRGLAIKIAGVTKRFPRVVANREISLEIATGEVHAVLGENGAGKTTLMNILAGLYRPDEGELYIRGARVSFASPRDAFRHGIGMVHQHFMLVPTFTVAQNVILGTQPPHGLRLDMKKAGEQVRVLSQRFGFLVEPDAVVSQLSVSAQQKVEILKLLYRKADILILDEPTACLAPQEIRDLFSILRRLAAERHTVILVTHKLREVLDVADRVTVLRAGAVVATRAAGTTGAAELARLMIGYDLVPGPRRVTRDPTQPMLSIRNLSVCDDRGLPAVRGLSLEVRDHEIVGIAGVDGNGQTELAEALSGVRRIHGGRILIGETDVPREDPRALIRRFDVATIPEDRQRYGLVLDFSVAENGVLPVHDGPPFARWLFIESAAVANLCRRLIDVFDIRPGDPRARAGTLSGGNQQKLILARELNRAPRVVVACQPTRGLDIEALDHVHRRLLEAAGRGAAVLLISQDLEELLGLSDRLVVMYRGSIVGEFPRSDIDIERVGRLMTGGH